MHKHYIKRMNLLNLQLARMDTEPIVLFTKQPHDEPQETSSFFATAVHVHQSRTRFSHRSPADGAHADGATTGTQQAQLMKTRRRHMPEIDQISVNKHCRYTINRAQYNPVFSSVLNSVFGSVYLGRPSVARHSFLP